MRGVKIAAWGLGILVVLGGGFVAYQREAPALWGAVHRYEAAQARANDTCGPHHNVTCGDVNYHESAYAAARGGPPFATPQANAMLRALKVQVVQARWLPKAWADPGPTGVDQYDAVAVDVELRVTNTSNRAVHMSDAAYTETGCMPLMQSTNSWTEPAVLLPISANLYAITPKILSQADQPHDGVADSPIVYLNLKPHQTKVGWIGALYVTNCGSSPNVVLFTDSWPSEPNGGAVTTTLPIDPVGPPLPVPASLP
ncbi:MAG: hypothetical protein ACP5QO_13365 [Clostridia bacterium]